LYAGYAFILEDEDGEAEHLHIVLTSPNASGEVITASISTRRAKSESLVVLQKGEHPFFRHESVCLYHFTRIHTCAAIQKAIAAGLARAKEDASPELVKKLCAGLLESEFVPRGIRAFYQEVTAAP
jgi:hypothetical protein